MTEPQNRDRTREGVAVSEVELYVGDIDFPCDKDELLDYARDRGAPFDVMQVLERFPRKQYASTVDIVHGFSHANRHQQH